MAASAEVFWAVAEDANVNKEQALKVLDIAAKEFIGADAEFDDEFYSPTPLSRLVAIAFDATDAERSSLEDGDDDGDAFYEGPYTRFRSRYKFC